MWRPPWRPWVCPSCPRVSPPPQPPMCVARGPKAARVWSLRTVLVGPGWAAVGRPGVGPALSWPGTGGEAGGVPPTPPPPPRTLTRTRMRTCSLTRVMAGRPSPMARRWIRRASAAVCVVAGHVGHVGGRSLRGPGRACTGLPMTPLDKSQRVIFEFQKRGTGNGGGAVVDLGASLPLYPTWVAAGPLGVHRRNRTLSGVFMLEANHKVHNPTPPQPARVCHPQAVYTAVHAWDSVYLCARDYWSAYVGGKGGGGGRGARVSSPCMSVWVNVFCLTRPRALPLPPFSLARESRPHHSWCQEAWPFDVPVSIPCPWCCQWHPWILAAQTARAATRARRQRGQWRHLQRHGQWAEWHGGRGVPRRGVW
jgi:hypothetical protein